MATTVIGTREIRPARFLASTNGKKVVMALTGVILFAFVIGHMIGNLQIYEGPEKLNAYGRFLHGVPEILWAVRAALLLSVGLHIWATVGLALRKNAARPIGYAVRKKSLQLCVADDVLERPHPAGLHHFPFAASDCRRHSSGLGVCRRRRVPQRCCRFPVWYVSAWYIFSMVLLGLHVRHGAWSMFQSLGFNHPRHTPILKQARWRDGNHHRCRLHFDSNQRAAGVLK